MSGFFGEDIVSYLNLCLQTICVYLQRNMFESNQKLY